MSLEHPLTPTHPPPLTSSPPLTPPRPHSHTLTPTHNTPSPTLTHPHTHSQHPHPHSQHPLPHPHTPSHEHKQTGEATSALYPGTVHGAYLSGLAAAVNIQTTPLAPTPKPTPYPTFTPTAAGIGTTVVLSVTQTITGVSLISALSLGFQTGIPIPISYNRSLNHHTSINQTLYQPRTSQPHTTHLIDHTPLSLPFPHLLQHKTTTLPIPTTHCPLQPLLPYHQVSSASLPRVSPSTPSFRAVVGCCCYPPPASPSITTSPPTPISDHCF